MGSFALGVRDIRRGRLAKMYICAIGFIHAFGR